MESVEVKAFYDEGTNTLSYLVWDLSTKEAVIIDPVLNYDPAASKVSLESLNEIKVQISENNLKPLAILETHAHADHLSSAQWLKHLYPGIPLAIGEKIQSVQRVFSKLFDLPESFKKDGSQFDILLKNNQVFSVGSLSIRVLATPGHTPACCSYLIGENLFTGDTLFMPDYGTGRCDFPEGSASTLYDSIQNQIYTLLDATKIYVGHDYQPNGRKLEYQSTVGQQKKSNIQLPQSRSKEDYVQFRNHRDKELPTPRLLIPSVQVNINAGKFPEPRANGIRYLNLPLYADIFVP